MQQKPPFITAAPNGAVMFNTARPSTLGPAHDYSRRPVQVAIRHDLTLEIHGENFSASIALTVDDALSIISRLAYGVREITSRTPTEFVEVGK